MNKLLTLYIQCHFSLEKSLAGLLRQFLWSLLICWFLIIKDTNKQPANNLLSWIQPEATGIFAGFLLIEFSFSLAKDFCKPLSIAFIMTYLHPAA